MREAINFDTYLKNAIPTEWVVDYYSGTPSYLVAGSMATKMFAWYHVVYPKRRYSPYNADMFDNSNDQNYLATSYSALSTTHKSYVDSALSTIKSTAMVNGSGGSTDKLFLSQYHANTGEKNGGKLNAKLARTLALNGYSYQDILRYFYDYSPNSGNKAIFFRLHN